jgi:hypothetical protein
VPLRTVESPIKNTVGFSFLEIINDDNARTSIIKKVLSLFAILLNYYLVINDI